MKLALIYNFAPKYRYAIFKLIDQTFDCDWYFGRNRTDIKGLDTSFLKSVAFVENCNINNTPLYTQNGLYRLVSQKDYDAILLLGEPFNLTSWKLMMSKRFGKRTKIYIWTHGWYGREGFAKKWLKRIYFKLADHVFTYGDYAKKIAGEQGFNTSKISVIHNSLDYPTQLKLRKSISPSPIYRNHFKNDNPTVVFIGRLTTSKRLDMLLESIALLKKDGTSINAVFIGEGEAMQYLKQLSHDLDIEDSVWFYGACYDEQTNAELIYNSDLCVSPGNVGLTAIHSLMFGTPVITHSNFPWQGPEFEAIKSGETGDFFEQGNVRDLSCRIGKWFKNHSADREEIRKACYREIDSQWTPEFQINVLKSVIK